MKPKCLDNLIEDSYSLLTRMRSGIRRAGLVALVGAIIGVGSMAYGAEPKEDALPKKPVSSEEKLYKQTKIAFGSIREGTNYRHYEIYVMNADGSEQKNLTDSFGSYEKSPSWSPDGKKIAFLSGIYHVYSNDDVWVMNADGSEQKRLTSRLGGGRCIYFSWSPDGKKIAFTFSERDGNEEIYITNSDRPEPKYLIDYIQTQRRLTFNEGNDACPLWSPDGKKIAFISDRDGHYDIYVMNADGSEQKRLTNNPDDDCMISSWSPDGKRISFTSGIYGNGEIYVMNTSGTNRTRLTFNESDDTKPLWSPDGKKIAFGSDRDGNYEIYVMNADGSEQKNLTSNPANDFDYCWSPDGKKIAFTSDRDGNSEIYVMNADGSEQKRLTNNPAIDSDPSWSPFLPLENKISEKK